jgi:C4-dicarboxylate transporter DctQ subunit
MFFRIINQSTKFLTILFLSVLTILVPVEVFLRYLFGKSLYITEEFTRYLMVWVVFLASSLAIRENAHISIGILVNRFQGRPRAWLNLLSFASLIFFLVFLMIEGIIILPYQIDQIIPSLEIPIFWFYLAIPVGCVLMILNLLPKVWENLKTIIGASPSDQGIKL